MKGVEIKNISMFSKIENYVKSNTCDDFEETDYIQVNLIIDYFDGSTQNIEIKIGRKTYLCDVNKNRCNAFIQVFDKLSNNRKSFSKYGTNLHCVSVKPDAHLKKDFFENIEILEKAQSLYDTYSQVLD